MSPTEAEKLAQHLALLRKSAKDSFLQKDIIRYRYLSSQGTKEAQLQKKTGLWIILVTWIRIRIRIRIKIYMLDP